MANYTVIDYQQWGKSNAIKRMKKQGIDPIRVFKRKESGLQKSKIEIGPRKRLKLAFTSREYRKWKGRN